MRIFGAQFSDSCFNICRTTLRIEVLVEPRQLGSKPLAPSLLNAFAAILSTLQGSFERHALQKPNDDAMTAGVRTKLAQLADTIRLDQFPRPAESKGISISWPDASAPESPRLLPSAEPFGATPRSHRETTKEAKPSLTTPEKLPTKAHRCFCCCFSEKTIPSVEPKALHPIAVALLVVRGECSVTLGFHTVRHRWDMRLRRASRNRCRGPGHGRAHGGGRGGNFRGRTGGHRNTRGGPVHQGSPRAFGRLQLLLGYLLLI